MPPLAPITHGIALAVLFALAIACGDAEGGDGGGGDRSGGSTPPAAGEPPSTVEVTLDEWSIKTSSGRARTGQLTFAVLNKGQTVHELAVVHSALAPARLPQSAGAVDEKKVEVAGRTPQLSGGKRSELRLTLGPGAYVLVCNIPAHYAQGMRAGLTVVE